MLNENTSFIYTLFVIIYKIQTDIKKQNEKRNQDKVIVVSIFCS